MEFQKFPKIPRYSRGCVITEKIDGTNAQVLIEEAGQKPTYSGQYYLVEHNGTLYRLTAGSRNRVITPEDDNYSFAQFVHENAEQLVELGVGRHFGEWWGRGIQRNYGQSDRTFSLFNVGRWNTSNVPQCCDVVPTLVIGQFSEDNISRAMEMLDHAGSLAAPGYSYPEGIVIHHNASKQLFKKTLQNDESPKGVAA